MGFFCTSCPSDCESIPGRTGLRFTKCRCPKVRVPMSPNTRKLPAQHQVSPTLVLPKEQCLRGRCLSILEHARGPAQEARCWWGQAWGSSPGAGQLWSPGGRVSPLHPLPLTKSCSILQLKKKSLILNSKKKSTHEEKYCFGMIIPFQSCSLPFKL